MGKRRQSLFMAEQRERTNTLRSVTEGDNVTVDKYTEAVPSLEDNPNIDKVISLFNFIKKTDIFSYLDYLRKDNFT